MHVDQLVTKEDIMNAWIRGVQKGSVSHPEVTNSPGKSTSYIASSSTDIIHAHNILAQEAQVPKFRPVQAQEGQELQEDIPPLEIEEYSDEEIEELSPPEVEAGDDYAPSPLTDQHDFPRDF